MNDGKVTSFLKKADYTGEIDFFGIGLNRINDIINTQPRVINPNDAVRSRMSKDIIGDATFLRKTLDKYEGLDNYAVEGIKVVVAKYGLNESRILEMVRKNPGVESYFADSSYRALARDVLNARKAIGPTSKRFYDIYFKAIYNKIKSVEDLAVLD